MQPLNALTELALGLGRFFFEFQRQGIVRSMLPGYCVNPCADLLNIKGLQRPPEAMPEFLPVLSYKK